MKRFGIGMVILGIMMITGAIGLLMQNREEERVAARSVQAVMVQIESAQISVPEEEMPEEMAAVAIDGRGYIGYLVIPVLELELPVMDQWSYEGLKTAPCRYGGSVCTDDLVVMAHNYESHFGRLDELEPGDEVSFTDMAGVTRDYRVQTVEILESGDVAGMTAGEWELTLFTCTYGGKKRLAVRCGKVCG